MQEIAQVWHDEGHRIVVQHGPGAYIPADLAILHVDKTVVPPDHLAYMRQYSRTINGHVADISKRFISDNLVSPDDDWTGEVIVKSNLNAAGFKEAEIAIAEGVPRDKVPRPVEQYQICARKDEIGADVWDDPSRIVEKFLPERREDMYCLRTWVFLGDKETNSLSYSTEPVVKQRTVVKREAVSDVPDELREMREQLAFDYGKFDYGIVDGRVVLYDANRTPSLGNFSREEFLPRIKHYAAGLRAFV